MQTVEAPTSTPAPADAPAPALDWIRTHTDEHAATDRERSAAGYAALLDALTRGVPEWLASFEPPPLLVGGEYDTINRYHVRYTSETPGEARQSAADELGAFLSFARSAELPRLTSATPEAFVPTWRRANPRLGFRAAPDKPAPALQGCAQQGEAVYRCHVTGRHFALPKGAPVPCLLYDVLDGDGEDPNSDAHPEDRNPHHLDLHPALAAQGSAAVLAALWGEVRGRLVQLAFDLEEILNAASLVAGVRPEDVSGGGQMAEALTAWERVRLDGGAVEYERRPAGWRDVGRSS